jgi:hypothetical protein
MNVQLANVISDVVGETGQKILRAICYVRQSARLIQSDCRADNEAEIGNAA